MAAVKVPSLSAAMGMNPRSSKGPKPKNNRGDVMLVQKLLQDTGLNVKINGKCDDKLIEAIKLGTFTAASSMRAAPNAANSLTGIRNNQGDIRRGQV